MNQLHRCEGKPCLCSPDEGKTGVETRIGEFVHGFWLCKACNERRLRVEESRRQAKANRKRKAG